MPRPTSSAPSRTTTDTYITSNSGGGGLDSELAARLASLEAVLFDLDGTLIDSVGLILASMRHATAEVLGEPLPDEVLMRNVGVPLHVQMAEFSEPHANELLVAYRAHNAIVHDELLCDYPGTLEAVRRVAATGVRLGIVTSKSRPVAERGIEHCGLGEPFDVLVAMEDTELHKPDPAPLVLAMERLGVAPERCAYVGDAAQDMLAARAAGVLAVAALWGVHPAGRVTAPGVDLAYSTLGEFAAELEAAKQYGGVNN